MAATTRIGPAGTLSRRWQQPVRLTALYHQHLGREASMAERDGWQLPRHYGNIEAEHRTVRGGAGLLDIGESGLLDVKSVALDALIATAFPTLGTVAVGHWAKAGGGTRIARLTLDQAEVITAPGAAQATIETLRGAASDPCTHLTDLTGARCGLRLLGPAAPAVLERLCSLDLTVGAFPEGSVAQTGVARIHALVARRDSGGLPGYDLSVDRDFGVYLWDALLEAGTPLGLAPVGRDVEEGLG